MKFGKWNRKAFTIADALVGLIIICSGSLFYFETNQLLQTRTHQCDVQLQQVRRDYEQQMASKINA
ncbi:type II secretion system protein [Fructilactobacillus myrtifloralis]|uniref:Type II secretion system protein n=1 Tax=Fructilactobacillus myrtifloralis TaxID=2940301 RepID=A0ABY5BNZ5_9LACO|nr:type II secretion system protein [Fructilactobacillus myrtifloralis]USS85204.1 type II secretion system protein [Fructilactobacillus myrtifloralis]